MIFGSRSRFRKRGLLNIGGSSLLLSLCGKSCRAVTLQVGTSQRVQAAKFDNSIKVVWLMGPTGPKVRTAYIKKNNENEAKLGNSFVIRNRGKTQKISGDKCRDQCNRDCDGRNEGGTSLTNKNI